MRIQDTKGGLLEDSYVWILDNPEFVQWRDDDTHSLLWIKGDPGKGKTMLLCGLIDHLQPRSVAKNQCLAYFFCQATDQRINTAIAVLRGLIFMLLDQHSFLLTHIEKKYETAGRGLFEDANAWQALCAILQDILRNPRLPRVLLVVDALDECTTSLTQLLSLIVKTSRSSSVKWLVSGRNWLEIEQRLYAVAQRLSLEANASSVAAAVESYITHKVMQLVERKRYRDSIATGIHKYLSSNANGTFLWVALICQELEATRSAC
ncbi:NACHT domain-containing protein [Microdochium nivale]|nr:NACHT domain-containing protein [Microdochium nivale]